MVGTCKVKTPACTNVVYDKNDAFSCADLAYLLPVAVSRKLVIKIVAVKVRSRNKCCDFAFIFSDDLFKTFDVVPVNIEVVCNVFGKDAGIVNLLSPCGNTVIETVYENDLFAVSCVTGCENSA